MTPATFTVKQACAYLNVSRSHFYRHIRPHIKGANLAPPEAQRPLMRFPKQQLDAFLAARMK